MKKKNIYFFTTNNPPKANIVERCQRTIRNLLFRMMREKRSYRYIDDLSKIVSNNATPHRSLNNLAPKNVNKSNEADVWAHMFLKKSDCSKIAKPVFKLNISDMVRISFVKQPFRKSYQDQYTSEVYKVSGRILKHGIPMFHLKDLKGDPIKGLFYD